MENSIPTLRLEKVNERTNEQNRPFLLLSLSLSQPPLFVCFDRFHHLQSLIPFQTFSPNVFLIRTKQKLRVAEVTEDMGNGDDN
ncbi:hypothetical protein P8452_37520 [Trifolium repens]|nr:hypothetical protein P8452_37520 [Trifolium repens]